MNSLTESLRRFRPACHPLPGPVAGVEVLLHPTCWPMAILLILQTPSIGGTGPWARLAAGVTAVGVLALAALGQLLVWARVSRQLGSRPSTAWMFPFGLVGNGGPAAKPGGLSVLAALAGPVVNLALGGLLTVASAPMSGPMGHWLLVYGLFSLVPCYPLPGGQVARAIFELRAGLDAEVDRKTLELARLWVCLLAGLGVLNLSFALLYALAVLWTAAHLALVPGLDLPGVWVQTGRWFRDRWHGLRSRVARFARDAFGFVAVLASAASLSAAGSKPEPVPASWSPALEWQAQQMAGLDAAVSKLRGDLVGLERQVRSLETNRLLPAMRFQRRAEVELRSQESLVGREEVVLRTDFAMLLQRAGCATAAALGAVAWSLLNLRRRLRRTLANRQPSAPAGGAGGLRPAELRPAAAPSPTPGRIGAPDTASLALPPSAAQPGMASAEGRTRPAPGAPVAIEAAGWAAGKARPLSDRSWLRRVPPDPTRTLDRLVAAASRARGFKAKPRRPRAAPWNIGWATDKGPVRTKNDDYAVAFEISGSQVVVIADGVSGEPHGGIAAFLACQSAAWSVARQLGRRRSGRQADATAVVRRAMAAAERAVAKVASACRCAAGMRTTLIILVAGPKAYAYAYIGDGRACVLGQNGTVRDFLRPQHAVEDIPNLLAACLGPTMLGSPVVGVAPRERGDLLIAGTDGVFSESVALGEDYPKRLLQVALHLEGDLQRTVAQTLDELNRARDELGFLFEDNLTLALVGDCRRPQLAAGFWTGPAASEAAAPGAPAQAGPAMPAPSDPPTAPHPAAQPPETGVEPVV